MFTYRMSNVLDLLNGQSNLSAIVIRHAQRHEIVGAEGYWTTGLTAAGLEQAHEFGRALAGRFSGYRVFHSPVKRCEQTAKAIAQELGVEQVRPENTLGVSYIRVSVEEGFAEADRHGDNFIRAWFSGRVPPEIFMPLPEARDIQIAYLRSKLDEAPRKTLDIHITHDWNINVLREGIFGLRHEDVGWPDFLSGLALSRDSGLTTAALADGKSIRKKIISAIPL